jgi:hypothetical protein
MSKYTLENLKSVFKGGQDYVEATLERPAFIDGIAYDAGAVLRVERFKFQELVACGAFRDIQGEESAELSRKQLNALLPEKPKPAPLPEAYKHLPKEFKTWWNLTAELEALEEYRDSLMQLITPAHRANQHLRSGFDALPSETQRDLIVRANDFPSAPKDGKTSIFLHRSYEAAARAVKDWQEKKNAELFLAQVNAGEVLKTEHSRVVRKVRDLNEGSKELFAKRISPLGLGKRDVERMYYSGSADYLTYHTDEPSLPSRKLLIIEGVADHYFYARLPEMAYYYDKALELETVVDRKLADLKAASTRLNKAAAA